MNNSVFCLMGPTASGKTDLALKLAAHFPFEIISVDSGMIYEGMDIGTAKPSLAIRRQYPHHLVDMITPDMSYSAAAFCDDVKSLIPKIQAQGRIPLLVGGTMMYLRALQEGLQALPSKDETIRHDLIEKTLAMGIESMHAWLKDVDPKTALRLHPHDTQRIQRALEIYLVSGQPMSAWDSPPFKPSYPWVNMALYPEDRAWLHRRIQMRFHAMLKDGLIDEVVQLRSRWSLHAALPSMRCVGYRQVWSYLEGEIDRATCLEKSIIATRQLAKRQLTWLRNWPDLTRIDPTQGCDWASWVSLIEEKLN